MDGLKTALIVTCIGIVVTVVGSVVLAWNSTGSRNLVLSVATLTAAAIFFVLQLPFELQTTTERDFVTAEFTVDRATPEIRQWKYPDSVGWRIHAETQASQWAAKHDVTLFESNRDKLTSDLTLFSLVSYLATSEFDWQRRTVRFTGSTAGTVTTWDRLSAPSECSLIDEAAFRSALKSATNVYEGAPIMLAGGNLCFPPLTTMQLTPAALTLSNPFCDVVFTLRPSGSISFMKPGTGGDVPTLPSGESRYETRLIGVVISTEFKALRAQHPDMAKYKAWAAQLTNGTREWFEGHQ